MPAVDQRKVAFRVCTRNSKWSEEEGWRANQSPCIDICDWYGDQIVGNHLPPCISSSQPFSSLLYWHSQSLNFLLPNASMQVEISNPVLNNHPWYAVGMEKNPPFSVKIITSSYFAAASGDSHNSCFIQLHLLQLITSSERYHTNMSEKNNKITELVKWLPPFVNIFLNHLFALLMIP